MKKKKYKNVLSYELAEVAAAYMKKAKQEEVTFKEIDIFYNFVKEGLNKELEQDNISMFISYDPSNRPDQILTFVPMLEIVGEKIQPIKHMDVNDLYIVLVKGMDPDKKKYLEEALDIYFYISNEKLCF